MRNGLDVLSEVDLERENATHPRTQLVIQDGWQPTLLYCTDKISFWRVPMLWQSDKSVSGTVLL